MEYIKESTPHGLFSQTLSLALCCLNIALKLTLYFFLSFMTLVIIRVLYRLRKQVFNCDLKDKPSKQQAVLITGATSGIGLALARYLHRRGYSVIAGYFTTAEPGYEELKKLDEDKKGENSIYFVELDVRSEESISRSYDIVKKILADYGLELHALVNNAGIASPLKTQYVPQATARAIIETNLLGPILMTKKYLPLLAKASKARVVNISSISAKIPVPSTAIYGATKVGLAYYTNSLIFDMKSYNVRFVTIYPGLLMKQTEVLTRSCPDPDRIYQGFSDDEREIYGDKFWADIETSKKLLSIVSKDKADKEGSKFNMAGLIKGYFRIVLKAANFLLGYLGDRPIKMEDSPFIENLDNAISMARPPGEMYAGNRAYNIIANAFLECTSHLLRKNLLLFLGFDNLQL